MDSFSITIPDLIVSDSCLRMANILFLLSYLQTELLIMRLILISASLFLFFYALKLPITSVDIISFDLLFIIIHALYSFRLISKMVPPKFNKEQKQLYNEYFSKIIKPLEFMMLLKYSRRRVYKVDTEVTKIGNNFESIFFIVKKSSEDINLQLKLNKTHVAYLDCYSWIGIVEYVELNSESSLKTALETQKTGEWTISFNINFPKKNNDSSSDIGKTNHDFDKSFQNENESKFNMYDEVVLYEWDLYALQKIFSGKEEGKNIMHGLHSMWLTYFSQFIVSQNHHNNILVEDNFGRKNSQYFNESDLNLNCEDSDLKKD